MLQGYNGEKRYLINEEFYYELSNAVHISMIRRNTVRAGDFDNMREMLDRLGEILVMQFLMST